MKRSQLKRKTALKADPEKVREFQRRKVPMVRKGPRLEDAAREVLGKASTICRSCGKEFTPRKAGGWLTTSCDSCLRERICHRCGKTFTPKPGRGVKYCSRECSNKNTAKARAKAIEGPRQHLQKRVLLPCKNCGMEFERTPGAAQKVTGGFCSVQCQHAYQREDFNPAIARTPRSSGPDYRKTFNLKLKGEVSCRSCGRPAAHLHHAVPRSLSTAGRADIRNGIPLCEACHMGWHWRTHTIYRDALRGDEVEFILSLPDTGRVISSWLDDRYPIRNLQHSATESGGTTQGAEDGS